MVTGYRLGFFCFFVQICNQFNGSFTLFLNKQKERCIFTLEHVEASSRIINPEFYANDIAILHNLEFMTTEIGHVFKASISLLEPELYTYLHLPSAAIAGIGCGEQV